VTAGPSSSAADSVRWTRGTRGVSPIRTVAADRTRPLLQGEGHDGPWHWFWSFSRGAFKHPAEDRLGLGKAGDEPVFIQSGAQCPEYSWRS
jgi:hypothetical protein